MSNSKYENLSEKEKLIVHSLEKPQYRWRTFEGLMRDTKLTTNELNTLLVQLGEKGFMLKTVNPKDGQFVYTTPDQYTKKHNFLEITLSAATGSIVF